MRSIFFFNDTATTEIYTLSLHDALPISFVNRLGTFVLPFITLYLTRDGSYTAPQAGIAIAAYGLGGLDRKSTRLNSSHANISFAVFCLKKKKNMQRVPRRHYHSALDSHM